MTETIVIDLVEAESTALTAAHLRTSFACFPSGVAAVCAVIDGEPVGMAMSSFTSVSLDPPLVSVCVDVASTTWPTLSAAATLGVSVLSEDQGHICRALASRRGDRFAEADWEKSTTGAVFISGASLTMECSLFKEVRVGDHDIVLLQPSIVTPRFENPPLVFHGSTFRTLAQ